MESENILTKIIDELELPGFLSDGADSEEISEALEEVYDQLDRLQGHLSLDTIDQAHSTQSGAPSINVHLNQAIVQNASASATAQINIKLKVDQLVKEFEDEYQKIMPNKSKLQSIIDKLKTLGPIAAPFAAEFASRIASMLL